MFEFGEFTSHSGLQLPWKFDADALSESDWQSIARIIALKFAFRSVYGVPRGGLKLAQALYKYREPGNPILIVDDVLTTGRSMDEARKLLGDDKPFIGVVVVARGPCPNWVHPILTINELFQS